MKHYFYYIFRRHGNYDRNLDTYLFEDGDGDEFYFTTQWCGSTFHFNASGDPVQLMHLKKFAIAQPRVTKFGNK